MTSQNKTNLVGSNTKVLKIILVTFLVIVVSILGLQEYAEYKIAKVLSEQVPDNMKVELKNINLNFLFNTVNFENIEINLADKNHSSWKTQIALKELKINGLNYWSLWKKKQLKADLVTTNSVFMTQKEAFSDSIKLSVSNGSLTLQEFYTDSIVARQKIPFKYKSLMAGIEHIYLSLSPFEFLEAKAVSLNNGSFKTDSISILSKYTKAELSTKIPYERDHISFHIENSVGSKFNVTSLNNKLKISVAELLLQKANLSVYRDKLVTDDTIFKPLYGSKLRNLPLEIDIKTVQVQGKDIFYSERIAENSNPQSISFKKWNARIDNLSNSTTKKTNVEASALLMGNGEIELDYSFMSNDLTDAFQVSSKLISFDASSINPFLKSNVSVRAEGLIQEMYFTVSGNNLNSKGDMKMKYKDFQFAILNKDKTGINKTLTAIGNIFTSDGSKTDDSGYRYGDIEVERDHTKSFFNYLWLNAKNGLLSTVVGDGKK